MDCARGAVRNCRSKLSCCERKLCRLRLAQLRSNLCSKLACQNQQGLIKSPHLFATLFLGMQVRTHPFQLHSDTNLYLFFSIAALLNVSHWVSSSSKTP